MGEIVLLRFFPFAGVSLVGGLSLDRRDKEDLVTVTLEHPVLRQRH